MFYYIGDYTQTIYFSWFLLHKTSIIFCWLLLGPNVYMYFYIISFHVVTGHCSSLAITAAQQFISFYHVLMGI